ncbi:hypothetical protein JRQ81_009134 [Phrynocephalus forsythii]|uniref:Nestin n=1 Tax=Phrynocephalus forsythii TaxID=171643 RepID=A0A9Q0XA86_9SAUR|nr:hypothetical protein JRQ81_009134 [Phrynocephalus forsythii]
MGLGRRLTKAQGTCVIWRTTLARRKAGHAAPAPAPAPGATGRSLEEVDGGAEDLEEVESPEALPLTAGEGRQHLHLPVELEPFQAPGALLCESGWASAEPLGPEALRLEEILAREEDFSATRSEEKAPAGEARVTGGREAEEGESEAKASEETPRDKEGDEEEKNAGDAGAGEARGNFSDTAIVRPKTLPKREDRLGNEAATEQEGFPAPDNAGPKDLQEENTLGNENLLEQEGLSDVKNTGHEGENEDVTHTESFPDMENMGCKDLHEEANHIGIGDRVEQEGFPGIENFGPKVIQEEEKDWERGNAIDGESFSAEESSSKHKALHEEEDEMGNGVTGEQEDLSVADNIGAEGLSKEASVLGNEDTPEMVGFSDVGGIECKDLRTEEDAAENEGTEEQEEVFPDMEMTSGSHEAVCLPDIAWAEENILRAEMLDGEQAEENSSRPAELLPTEQKMEKEDDSPEVSPMAEGDAPVGGDWETGTEAIEVEKEEAGGLLETEDTAGHLRTNHLKVDENPPQSSEGQEGRTGTLAAEEQPMAMEGQLASQGQHATHIGQAPACEIQEEPPAPAEMPSSMADERGAKDQSDPGSLQLQRDSSGLEDSLESWGTSPNTTCERDALGKEATLEETLPGHTPFHVDDEQRPAATGACPWPSESEEATKFLPGTTGSAATLEGAPHVLEGGSQSSPQLQESSREGENTGEQSGHPTKAAPSQHIPGSPELPAASKDLEVVPNETSESEDSHPGEASGRREFWGQDPELSVEESDRQPEEETSQPGSDTAGEQKPTTTQTYEGESRTDLAGEAEKGGIVPGDDLLALNNLQRTAHEEEGGSLELSEESITEEVSQVSPLTSVDDLGEIVLEGGDAPASGQRGAAEPKVLTGCQEGLHHTSPPDHTPEEALSETGPSSSKDSPCASAEAAVSVSAEGMKDSDILEIVEQALEFNQELIRAAEERAEAELSALGGGGVPDLPEGQGHVASTPSWETGEPQATGDVAKVSPLSAKDPTETPGPWVTSDTNGLPQEPGLPEIAKVLELNGLSHLPQSHGEEDGSDSDDGGSSVGEFVKKDAVPQGSPREEVQGFAPLQSGSHGPPQGPANDEAKRWAGQDVLLIAEGGSPGNKTEPVALGLKGGLSADLMQAACLKGGKGPEMGALPILPAFEEEALRLESGQHLKFRPEAEEELWSQEDP